ncbi:MAG: hypothetical protein E7650_05225 [Ruminococcaceae bacterium]|nr:hypothetical protein [Oscillospiraceae bacterium]
MPKKTNLNLGFLLLYDWLPAVYELPAKEVKALLIALIERQREGKPLPIFKNRMTNSFALMIEPVIKRRLDGQAGGKKGHEGGEVLPPVTAPQREEEESAEKEKISLFERRREEIYKSLSPTGSAPKETNQNAGVALSPTGSAPKETNQNAGVALSPTGSAPKETNQNAVAALSPTGSAPEEKNGKYNSLSHAPTNAGVTLPQGVSALPLDEVHSTVGALSYEERGALLEAGVPSEYLNDRLPRAAEWAAKTKKRAYSVLLEWWAQDKARVQRRGNLSSSSDSSFDADEVFAMMLAKTYQCDTDGRAPANEV